MTATLDDVTARKKKPDVSAEEKAAVELVRLAREQGLSLTCPDGLLRQLTKTVLETALNEDMTEHKKRQRRLSGVDEIVLSLYARGLTTGEISAHFAEIYGASQTSFHPRWRRSGRAKQATAC
jgi:putative transposase